MREERGQEGQMAFEHDKEREVEDRKMKKKRRDDCFL